ncbi:hypothetical protein QTP88_019056 [Uroleucon formosanum]
MNDYTTKDLGEPEDIDNNDNDKRAFDEMNGQAIPCSFVCALLSCEHDPTDLRSRIVDKKPKKINTPRKKSPQKKSITNLGNFIYGLQILEYKNNDMGARIDDLEKNISDLMIHAGLETPDK